MEEQQQQQQQLSVWRQKEGTMLTDDQGVQWTLVSLGYRPGYN
jgi:hypothetical protein